MRRWHAMTMSFVFGAICSWGALQLWSWSHPQAPVFVEAVCPELKASNSPPVEQTERANPPISPVQVPPAPTSQNLQTRPKIVVAEPVPETVPLREPAQSNRSTRQSLQMALAKLEAQQAAKPKSPAEMPKSAKPQPFETGPARWYGEAFQGRRTANGDIFSVDQLTAAHPKLPFGTRVRVTNLSNQRSVIVKINDRGGFRDGHIIDLSKAAAERIDMLRQGVATVRLEVIENPSKM